MKRRTLRKRNSKTHGGFIFIVPTILTIGSGLLIVKRVRRNLIKELNTLSSKQVKQLLKKISPKKEYINRIITIKYIESKIDIKDKKSKGKVIGDGTTVTRALGECRPRLECSGPATFVPSEVLIASWRGTE